MFSPHQHYLTDPSQDFPDLLGPKDQIRSYPMEPIRLTVQIPIRSPVETTLHDLRDIEAFPDHVVIT